MFTRLLLTTSIFLLALFSFCATSNADTLTDVNLIKSIYKTTYLYPKLKTVNKHSTKTYNQDGTLDQELKLTIIGLVDNKNNYLYIHDNKFGSDIFTKTRDYYKGSGSHCWKVKKGNVINKNIKTLSPGHQNLNSLNSVERLASDTLVFTYDDLGVSREVTIVYDPATLLMKALVATSMDPLGSFIITTTDVQTFTYDSKMKRPIPHVCKKH